jgi:hypothetical protein
MEGKMGKTTAQKYVDSCGYAFISWIANEKENKDMTIHDEEFSNDFIFQMFEKKFKMFGVNIVLPDELIAIICMCTNSNPGQSQIILKYLLDNIKNRKGPISKGYIITTDDFVNAFSSRFPILHQYEDLNEKFQKLWDEQKMPRVTSWSDNKCDTPEWWLEVMEE